MLAAAPHGRLFALLLLALGWAAAPGSARAQPAEEPARRRFAAWAVGDAVALGAGIEASDALRLGGAVGVLALVGFQDAEVFTEARRLYTRGARRPIRIVEELGNARVVRPAAAMVLVGALASRDARLQDAAFTSLQAVVYANTVTNALKSVSGRARPYQARGPDRFAPFSGNTSFPSGHATTVFALAAPWFAYYPGPATGGLLAVASATAFSRVVTERHWASDVAAGAAIGGGMGLWLARRHQRRPSETPRVQPYADGSNVGVTIQLGAP